MLSHFCGFVMSQKNWRFEIIPLDDLVNDCRNIKVIYISAVKRLIASKLKVFVCVCVCVLFKLKVVCMVMDNSSYIYKKSHF